MLSGSPRPISARHSMAFSRAKIVDKKEVAMPGYSAKEFRDFRVSPGMGKKIGVLITALVLVAGSTGIVGAGQRGVLLRFGAVTGTIKEEGLYYKIPFAEQVVLMSMQIQKYTAPANSSSKDLDRKSTRLNSSHIQKSRMPSSA